MSRRGRCGGGGPRRCPPAVVALLLAALGGGLAAVEAPPVAWAQTVTADEDVLAAITLAGSDPAGGDLAYRIAAAPAGGALFADAAGAVPVAAGAVLASPTVYFRSATNANGAGIGTFAFTVEAGGQTSAPAAVTVDVLAVNDPPRLDPLPDLTVSEDVASPIDLDLAGLAPGPATAGDEAGQAVSLYALVDTRIAGFVTAYAMIPAPGIAWLFVGVAADGWGSGRIYVVLTDDGGTDHGGSDVSISSFLLTVEPTPDPPVLTANDPVTITGADTIVGSPRSEDPDGGAGLLRVLSLPLRGTLTYEGAPVAVGDLVDAATARLRYQRTDAGRQDDAFDVMLADYGGVFADQGPYTVSLVMPGPYPPVIATTWLGTLQDLPRTATLAATDADSAVLTWSLGDQPAGARIDLLDAAAGLVRITPEAGWAGESTCAVMVGDGDSDPVQAVLAVRVTGLDAPRAHIAGEAPPLVEAGADLDLSVPIARDDLGTDGTLSCALAGDPPAGLSASVEGAAVRLRWTVPADAAAGTWYDVQVLLIDDASRTVGAWPIRIGVRPRPQGVN